MNPFLCVVVHEPKSEKKTASVIGPLSIVLADDLDTAKTIAVLNLKGKRPPAEEIKVYARPF